MGKTAKQSPSRSKMSKTKHKHSHNISIKKKHRKLKKEFKLKRKSIQHLFNKLKNQGVANFQNDSIIFHDNDYHNTPPIKNKRKHSVIIIDDEPTITEEKRNKHSTLFCSTPCKGKQSIIAIDEPPITAIDKPTITTVVEPNITTFVESAIKTIVEPNIATIVEPTIATIVEPTIATTVEPTLAITVEPTITTVNEPTITAEDKPTIITKIKEANIPISSTPNKNDNTELNKDLNISNVSVANINNNLDIINLNDDTKEINRDSYFTIDLTTESNSFATAENTVIDLDKLDTDCSFISANSSMSGDSEVTVIRASLKKRKDIKNDTKMRKFAEGIANMNATEKGRLLSLITENIFNGCKMPETKKTEVIDVETYTRAPDTAEDTYIKQMILGQKASRNSIGSNIYNPVRHMNNRKGLRMVVIDGSNVAMEHGMGRIFSVRGLKICIDFFLKRGHTVKAFVPRFRCKYGKSSLPKLLDEMERRGYVVFTPSREVRGRQITSYDDRYIVQCAAEFEGVIVSGDNYRDLLQENPRWRQVIETRLLQFTWVHDMIMFPKDPLGRNGPTLEQFLRH